MICYTVRISIQHILLNLQIHAKMMTPAKIHARMMTHAKMMMMMMMMVSLNLFKTLRFENKTKKPIQMSFPNSIDDCDDSDEEDELEPGEGEAVWEEEEVEGGIEIVEECPDDEDGTFITSNTKQTEELNQRQVKLLKEKYIQNSIYSIDDCDDDECEEDSDYEYEDGIEETAVVSRPDDDGE